MFQQEQLNKLICAVPGCEHNHDNVFYFHSACHVLEPIEALYDKDTGSIKFSCSECKKEVCEVLVAKGV